MKIVVSILWMLSFTFAKSQTANVYDYREVLAICGETGHTISYGEFQSTLASSAKSFVLQRDKKLPKVNYTVHKQTDHYLIGFDDKKDFAFIDLIHHRHYIISGENSRNYLFIGWGDSLEIIKQNISLLHTFSSEFKSKSKLMEILISRTMNEDVTQNFQDYFIENETYGPIPNSLKIGPNKTSEKAVGAFFLNYEDSAYFVQGKFNKFSAVAHGFNDTRVVSSDAEIFEDLTDPLMYYALPFNLNSASIYLTIIGVDKNGKSVSLGTFHVEVKPIITD